jgi:hypothetical protein
MSDPISDLKVFITAQLRTKCEPFAPKTETSQQVHLEVGVTRDRPTQAIGVEFDHKDRVNFWVVSMYTPSTPPETVVVARKVWKGTVSRLH